MNISKIQRRAIDQAGAATPNCPAQALGREMDKLRDEIRVREERSHTDGAAWNRLLVAQIDDRIAHLSTQLQWVKATTLEGLYVQLAQLRVMHQIGDAEDDQGQRGMERLFELMTATLQDLAGVRPHSLGSQCAWDAADFGDVLQRYTGQAVAREA
jgi:hypothetical protein